MKFGDEFALESVEADETVVACRSELRTCGMRRR
jgi:hypothetical protein